MPFSIIRRGNEYAVKTIATGKTHGYTTKEKAEAQMRILNGIEGIKVRK